MNSSPSDRLRVLLIEDNPGDARLFEEVLGESDCPADLRWEETVTTGLKVLDEERPDVIVADLGLSGSGGRETVEQFAEAAPDLPVVVLASQQTMELAMASLDAGATAYLRKDELMPGLVARTLQAAVERTRIEAKLRQQRNLLEQAQRLVGAWEIDLRSDQMTWSEEVYRIHEVEPGTELDAERGLEFYAPEARPKIREAFEQCIEERKPFDVELPIDTAKGNRRWVRAVGMPSKEEGGEVVKVAGAFQDITEQKRREQKFAESEARYRALAESARDVLLTIDADSTIQFVNPAVKEVFGYAPEELVGESLTKLMPERYREEHQAALDRFIETGERRMDWSAVEFPGQREDGEEVDLSISFSEYEEQGELRLQGIIRDVTERKEREDALRESEERFRGLFENAALGIALLDKDGVLLEANPALGSMLGYDAEELRGKHFEEMTHPDYVDTDKQLYQELVDGKRDQYQMEKQYLRQNGETFWGHLTVSRQETSDGIQVIGMVEDIDEQKRYEEDLRQAKEEAEEASRLKSSMLANMSHEIRTPLTAITGFGGLLTERLTGEPREFAERVEQSGQRLMKTLDSVLQLSKLEAGAMKLERESVRLEEVVHDTLRMMESAAEEKSLTVETSLPEQSVAGRWNEGALNRIVENLLENAIKFTPKGGRVDLRVSKEDGKAVLEVEDTGIGIGEEALSQIFEPFKQESVGLDREYEGSGLGLSVVKELAELLGGEITVESEKGQGTCFIVRLPLDPEVE